MQRGYEKKIKNITRQRGWRGEHPLKGDVTMSRRMQSPPATAGTKSPLLYALPYDIEHGKAAHRLNSRDFHIHLRRSLMTHLQARRIDDVDLTVRRFPATIDSADTENVRSVAANDGALAVISGEGEQVASEGAELTVVESDYRIIPSLPQFPARSLLVDEIFSEADLHQLFPLRAKLRNMYGGATVLALAVHEALGARGNDDPTSGLERARDYLRKERRLVGPREGYLVRQIDELLELIEKELDR